MEKIHYKLNKKEQKKYISWKKNLPKVSESYIGTPNGSYWFKFRYTGIGIIVEAGRDDVPDMDINLTDYSSW